MKRAAGLVTLALLASALPAEAGGPRRVNGQGVPLTWPSGTVVYHPEAGGLGVLSPAEALTLLRSAYPRWLSGYANLTLSDQPSVIPLDINAVGTPATNPAHWANFWCLPGSPGCSDGRSPVIFDDDGSIVDDMFGSGARFDILGAASIDDPITLGATISQASLVVNGAFFDGLGAPDSPPDLPSVLSLEAVLVHEIGHTLNLDHSVVNQELANDGDPDNDLYVPTMFPLTTDDEAALADVNPDDWAAVAALYPAADFATTTGKISGHVVAGGLPFQGADVVLRANLQPLYHAYSGISGARFFPCNVGGACYPCSTSAPCVTGDPPEQGAYSLAGLAPSMGGVGGYRICVAQLDTRLSIPNGTFIGPLATPATIPGPEECYAIGESASTTDNPDAAGVQPVFAGANLGPFDILINDLPGSDGFEPNNTSGTASVLADLSTGSDTAPAFLAASDLDFYQIPVTTGDTIRIDVDAAEIGSGLDAMIQLYDGTGVPLAQSDDGLDPDSGSFSVDPALTLQAGFTGTARLVVSSYPDLDFNGSGGLSTGPYWIRVIVDHDSDADGAPDRLDRCRFDPDNDADGDGICADVDQCPAIFSPPPLQLDTDSDGRGDFCDNCPVVANFDQADGDGDGFGDACDSCPADPRNDSDSDTVCGNVDNCPTLYNPTGAVAAAVKLNGTLASGGNVAPFAGFNQPVARANDRVVYIADQDLDTVDELYSAPIGGGAATKLNPALPTGRAVTGFAITPDGTSVVYLADQNADDVFELFRTPIGGGSSTRLNGNLAAGGDVQAFSASPDGSRVVYSAVQVGDVSLELYSVPIGGGTPVRLSGPLALFRNVVSFAISPDNTRVVYLADQDTDTVNELYSVPVAGGSVAKLNPTLGGGRSVETFQISPDSTRVVYLADQDANNVLELYSVPLTGGATTKLNGSLVGSVVVLGGAGAFAITPHLVLGAHYVVYAAQRDSSQVELYSVPITGGVATEINAPFVPGGNIVDYEISDDSTTVVYTADQELDGLVLMYSVSVGGGVVTRRFTPVGGTPSINIVGVRNSRIVYLADQDIPNFFEIFSIGMLSGTYTRLNGPLVPEGDVILAPQGLSPDGTTLVYAADQELDGRVELYSVPIAGGPVQKVSGPMVTGGGASVDFTFSPDSRRIVYLARQQSATVTEMYSAWNAQNTDADGILNACDLCTAVTDPTQPDIDGDGIGDSCDNCRFVANPTQDAVACRFTLATISLGLPAGTGSGGGPAWGDYDGDGDEDVYDANMTGAPSRLLRNNGGSFAVVSSGPLTSQAGLATWADYDNKGGLDLYKAGAAVPQLLRNDGAGVFTSVPAPGFGNSPSAAWADADNDGDIDLHSCAGNNGLLLLNQGGAGFVSDGFGILCEQNAWGDYDNDGDPDLFLAHSTGSYVAINSGGAVQDVIFLPPSHGGSWGDYDNDGDLDLYINTTGPAAAILRNDSGIFVDVTAGVLPSASILGAQSSWADFDNDGDLDLVASNTIFRNENGTHFLRSFESIPIAAHAWGDSNADGQLELYLSSGGSDTLLTFPDTGNSWLELRLKGVVSNRAAIGARVQLVAGSLSQIREVSSDAGHAGQDSLVVHFGLGTAALADTLEIHWPSGTVQTFYHLAVNRRITIVEPGVPPDDTPPVVTNVFPASGSLDVALGTDILLAFSEPLDPATADGDAIVLSRNGAKIHGNVHLSPDGLLVSFDPLATLQADSDYTVQVTTLLRDSGGEPAVPFLSTFDTTANAGSGTIDTGQVGTEESGAILPGTNADDHSGFAVAAAGEVNGDDLADILIGAPNADAGGSVDAGKVTLVFGSVGLQSAGGALDTLEYLGEAAGQRAGSAVARAGDIDGDGVGDFLIGAPGASPHGTGSGRVYLVFGDPGLDDVPVAGLNLADLAACAAPTLCGVAFNGEATGDSAGAAVSAAGDLNHDGHDDLLIAAPGASPGSRVGAGKVYLVYGAPSFPPGVVELSAIATRSLPGHVFHGEGAGDRAGESISSWPDVASAVDDLIIGAPGGDVTEFSSTILDAGYVYAIHGGTTNLCQNPQPCSPAIELSRVANGLPDQVAGVVFLGTEPGGEIGRSVTGEVDVDGDGVPDIIIGADQEAWVIPGDDPKGETTSSPVKKDPDLQPGRLREPGGEDAINRFGAVFFSAGSAGELGGVAVGAAGDVNHDGVGDFILGAPGVDAPGEPDAGAAYLVYGSRFPRSRETLLSDIGVTVPGLAIAGSDGGDQTGRSVGGGSDFNGDGIADALVGAPFADVAATTPTDGGETYVISPVTPDEVVLVKLRKTAPPGTAALEWTVADRAVSYNVYRGLLAQLHLAGPVFTSNMTQLACGIASDADSDGLPDTTDPLVPAAQAGFYYLVTGNNLQGEGPLGPAGATPPRTNDAQCP